MPELCLNISSAIVTRLFSPPMANQIHLNSTKDEAPHFVLVPMMAQGHMIPMVDMACLLAGRGAVVSLVVTPVNASRLTFFLNNIKQSIRLIILRFPGPEAGLPEGCENLDSLPSRDLSANFFHASTMLKEPLISHLHEHEPSPSCIISDVFHTWTREVALEFGIKRFNFNGFGCFSLLIRHIMYHDNIFENTIDDNETVVVHGLPQHIEITRAQSPGNLGGPAFEKIRDEMMRVEATADGVVVNSFDDFEPSYRERFQKTVGKKVWTIGPMSLCNSDVSNIATRGDKASIDEDQCLRWLDSMKRRSILYVSFGSLARTPPSQLIEIGMGLEASNCPFVWVIKVVDDKLEDWLFEFEERTRGRGLIIRGWAPQVMILSHPAVGGFMTHCGWNSVLEGVTAGVPMLTWPHFADQFLNEKLIVEVLRIGVALGVKTPIRWGLDDGDNVAVKRGEIEKAVSRLMDGGEEGGEIRRRVEELGNKAKKAMEPGGSSYEQFTDLIQYSQAHLSSGRE